MNTTLLEDIPEARVDARQRRSRARLHDAVLELAGERRIETISATEIAERAGVNRSTFYEHAASPSDLLVDALRGELDAARATFLTEVTDLPAAVSGATRAVLVHVREHAEVYRVGLTTSGALHDFLSEHFQASARLVGLGGSELAVRYIADGTVGAIASWVQAARPDVDEFLTAWASMLPASWPRP